MKITSLFKTLILLMAFMFFLPAESMAQKKSGPPSWAPAHGYRAKTRHIYFPDHNFYFDLNRNVYIYLNSGSWLLSAAVPRPYAGISFNTAKKIELDLNTDFPQKYNADHKAKYKSPKPAKAGVKPQKAAKPAARSQKPSPPSKAANHGKGGGKGKH